MIEEPQLQEQMGVHHLLPLLPNPRNLQPWSQTLLHLLPWIQKNSLMIRTWSPHLRSLKRTLRTGQAWHLLPYSWMPISLSWVDLWLPPTVARWKRLETSPTPCWARTPCTGGWAARMGASMWGRTFLAGGSASERETCPLNASERRKSDNIGSTFWNVPEIHP